LPKADHKTGLKGKMGKKRKSRKMAGLPGETLECGRRRQEAAQKIKRTKLEDRQESGGGTRGHGMKKPVEKKTKTEE